ncbi:RHS repeat-associated core domain-containing protein [Streptomyces sp. NPDC006476]|uniref:RHS repeat-associated core domain-containing protein n=1 Tax=Streptomyces sp. NPDC006476 TaxID=3157175 RepID=UPI0033B1C236
MDARNIKRNYNYPPVSGKQPHTLTKVDTTGPNGVAHDTYTYDAAGNTQKRTISGDKQTFTWDAEGHLAQATKPDGSGGTKTTSYVYDADGNRLITRTDTDTTLYLGSTQITLAKGATTPKATRYYDLGGGNQAVRTDDNKLFFLIGDHHGTSQLAINAADLTLQQRRSTPFGAARGKAPTSWPGDKGFVGGTQDAGTGLTHLGARDYDPATGRFLSADPVLAAADPQQINGYSYSDNSPVTRSDPPGLESCGPSNPGCSKDNIDSINHTGRYHSARGNNKSTKSSATPSPVCTPPRTASRSSRGSDSPRGKNSWPAMPFSTRAAPPTASILRVSPRTCATSGTTGTAASATPRNKQDCCPAPRTTHGASRPPSTASPDAATCKISPWADRQAGRASR